MVFQDLENPAVWLEKYMRWLELKAEVIQLERQKASDQDLDAIEEKAMSLHLAMAKVSPPERFLWHQGRPILDRWQVAFESENE